MQLQDERIPLPDPTPLLVVLTGPSGVGKDTVLRRLGAEGANRHVVVTATTRPQRTGERDGVDYHFLPDRRQFEALIREGYFLEWAQVYGGHYYGTPRDEVIPPLERGQDVLLRVDVQGAATFKQTFPDAIVVFLAPEHLDELRERIARPGETAAAIAERTAKAAEECALIPAFDYVVVNRPGALAQTVTVVEAIITAEHARTHPRKLLVP